MSAASIILNTVFIQPAPGNLTDRSGSISLGNVAQTLMAANPLRRGWRIQNNSTADLWFNDTGGTANAGGPGSFRIAAGGYFETSFGGISNTTISIVGGTAGQVYSASEW